MAAHLEPLCAHRPLPLVLILIPKPPAYLILREERRHLRVRRDRIVVRDLDGAVGVELPEDGGLAVPAGVALGPEHPGAGFEAEEELQRAQLLNSPAQPAKRCESLDENFYDR